MGKLTDEKVMGIMQSGRYSDGDGLYLSIGRGGAFRAWVMLTTVQGKRCSSGLGSAGGGSRRYLTLAEAREKAAAYLRILRAGGDPRLRGVSENESDTASCVSAVDHRHSVADVTTGILEHLERDDKIRYV